MKLVHLADLHLGYRAYHRTNERGINVREGDVARAFRQALDRTLELRPDLVLIGGDVFHSVRPSNAAIADAFRQFSRFCAALPEARVVIVAGNHDSPKAVETGSILQLFAEIPGIHVAHHEPKRLRFPELDLSVLCLPHNALISEDSRPAVEPDPGVTHNIVLAHANFDSGRDRLIMDFGAAKLGSEEIVPEVWTYVALGNYHVRERLAPNMCYSGAIERTSLNIWAEADNAAPGRRGRGSDPWPGAAWGKGFVEFDVDENEARFHALEGLRPVLDLEPILADGLSAAEVDHAIATRVEALADGIEGKVIRLRAFDLPRGIYRELDHKRIREYRSRALHFQLDARPPQLTRHVAGGAPSRRLSLQEELVAFLEHRWKPEAEKKDRDRLIELAVGYLQEVEEAEAAEAS